MKVTRFMSTMLLTACICGAAGADDGEKVLKSMSQTINTPTINSSYGLPVDMIPEAEHAFTSMMKFYVPAQAADGELLTSIDYNNADGADVEELTVAKPLVNVFIYGPAHHVDGTAFAHSFMDVYGAVSLDDGLTWKQTNLSKSAHLTSYNIETDPLPKDPVVRPGDHNVLLGSKNNGALHAPGYETPYTAHCTECHGPALTGTAEASSCYSCHGSRWKEEPIGDVGPLIYQAIYKNGKLEGFGENAASMSEVTVVNGHTGESVSSTDAYLTGDFHFLEKIPEQVDVPCTVAAVSDGEQGPALTVTDKNDVPLEECAGLPIDVTEYPGGAYNVFHATAGNRVLVAWPSRYCGQEGMTKGGFAFDEAEFTAVGTEIRLTESTFTNPISRTDLGTADDLYLADIFGVAGSQGSTDFADEGYPQAGVVPFGCVWTARGFLRPDPEIEGASEVIWTKPEQLTSGRRDPNRIEVRGVAGAGFVITWQEDPDGIRPGQGLGPGEGWSGAVAHSQTDIWYSFIPWEYYDIVDGDGGAARDNPLNIMFYDSVTNGNRPKAFVPMAVPMRLSNNAKCQTEYEDDDPSYCNPLTAAQFGLKNSCLTTVDIPLGPQGTLTPICVDETGLPNVANTAATRPRLSLQGYDSDADGLVDSAWVVVAAEESKGLGRFGFEPDTDDDDTLATSCDLTADNCQEDIGKNQWYFSFDMGSVDTSAHSSLGTTDEPYGLVNNLVNQGDMLNQPEVQWDTGEFFGEMSTADMWDFGENNFTIYNTEIARRASLLVQGIGKAVTSKGANGPGLLAIPSWKQGTMRQGGPADTMFRRIILPDSYSDGIANNPYAFINMECDNWAYLPDENGPTNPYYPHGVCLGSATNLSSVVPDTCTDSQDGGSPPCPTVDFTQGTTFGIGDTNPILQGSVQYEGNTTKVLTWHQCPFEATDADETVLNCMTEDGTEDNNLQDQSWYNPLDISKGHRGFIDGDFVMFLYAWSPNWRLNAKGSDRYDLYVRRSFDGGETWTTLPSSFIASTGDPFAGAGTVTCESYRATETGSPPLTEPKACFSYAAGANEQARNVTQHKSMRITTLDPRYASTPASIDVGEGDEPTCLANLRLPEGVEIPTEWTCDDVSELYDSDLRDPSRYFMVYETGDNTTVEVGEAEPMSLYYSRAVNFGDDYLVWADEVLDTDLSDCYPNKDYSTLTGLDGPAEYVNSGFCNEFDRMDAGGETEASEASLASNPDGSKLYGVWTQHALMPAESSDAMARRVWWIEDFIPANAWILGGGQ